MKKISSDFIIRQYQSGIEQYRQFTLEVGLWLSEKYVIAKYFDPGAPLLDLGCGTGRTTFGMADLGFRNLTGIDLCPEMISAARDLNPFFGRELDFRTGDAAALEFPDASFAAVLFSFNGLMGIPHSQRRMQALREIHRVLKPGGVFCFTCHDRDRDSDFEAFWANEKFKWDSGLQRPELHEFGDLITQSANENSPVYIHIPDYNEIDEQLRAAGFRILETFYRSDRFDESSAVKARSDECRFWVAGKP